MIPFARPTLWDVIRCYLSAALYEHFSPTVLRLRRELDESRAEVAMLRRCLDVTRYDVPAMPAKEMN